MSNEANTCREYVVPKLNLVGWDTDPHSIAEQHFFTDGRILVIGNKQTRQKRKFADYLLKYTGDFPIAVVEAKREGRRPGDGLQQAKDYAEILDMKFAYATNGHGIVEFDYLTGQETSLDAFPTPDALWARLQAGSRLTAEQANKLLTPDFATHNKRPRYYQQIAINRAMQAIVRGNRRVLLTMATGTGKTTVAFQICWKLWSQRWNATGEARPPRILFLADRNILVDDPRGRDFLPFGDARHKIETGDVVKSREMYFAIYQALTAVGTDGQPVYKRYRRDFFDLIVVDECHRGSASEESSWRDILSYFEPAYQLGMTATPKRDDNVDTYAYFSNPIYTYSLKQGIEDGFLAPYRVHRVVTSVDAAGWRPSKDDLDRYSRAIPDGDYQTKDFERVVAFKARTQAIARHLTNYLRATDRFAKTLVFCVDQDHALEMRQALVNLNSDLVQQYPDYVCRVTSDELDIGRGHLSKFQDIETRTPVILTTSQMLTTGVDAQMVKNVVLARVIGSMTEFKQIIGRGTRLREDYGKLHFTILDYTGSATRQFADPGFDVDSALMTQEEIDALGNTVQTSGGVESEPLLDAPGNDGLGVGETAGVDGTTVGGNVGAVEAVRGGVPRKYYYDGGQVSIVDELVYDLDADGKQISPIKLVDYTGKQIRTLYRNSEEIRALWADPTTRNEIVSNLAERGIDFGEVARLAGQPEADPFDLMCHLAYGAPLLTRRERAEKLRRKQMDFFDQFGPQARAVLGDLLDKYTTYGTTEFRVPEALRVPPISDRGNVSEIIRYFGGADAMRQAVGQLQNLLYTTD